MKGSPIAECLVVLAIFVLLLIPLVHLSGQPPPQAHSIEHGHADDHGARGSNVTAWAILHFAHPPHHVHIHQGDHDVWHIDPKSGTEFTKEVVIKLNRGFAEFVIHVDWPVGTPESIVELTLEPDGLDGQVKSSWGREKLDTVWGFQW